MSRDKDIVKGPFWSNCFIEAMKAKIRHPFRVRVTAVIKSEAGCPHFLWSDGLYDYDFSVYRRLSNLQILWFRGYIRRHELGFSERYKELMHRQKVHGRNRGH